MTRIDFYSLVSGSRHDIVATTCLLIEKARARGQRVHIHTDDHALAESIDQKLWNFRADSFIPHIVLDQVSRQAPEQIREPNTASAGDISQINLDSMTATPTHDLACSTASKSLTPSTVQVTIGTDLSPQSFDGVLINLARSVPTFFSRFERTLEIVDDSDTARAQSRDRYRFYQKRGYPLKHHKLGN